MDEQHKITGELYNCFNLIRSTVEGVIPYCNNSSNIWNVPGGLKRVKKATFEILKNGLRFSSQANIDLAEEPLKKLCCKLIPSTGNNIVQGQTDDQSSEQVLNEWIEKHLLDHSLHERICNLFVETWSEKILQSYKEYAYVKNEVLLQAFLACLDALQHGSMNQLSSINPSLMNRSTFMNELKPWVTDKMTLEEDYTKNQEQLLYSDTTCYGLYTSPETDELYKDEAISQKDSAISSSIFESSSEQPSSIPSDLLMNSALSVVCENDEEDVGWYADSHQTSHETDDKTAQCRRESLLSESTSLYQEVLENNLEPLEHLRQHCIDEASVASDLQINTIPRTSSNISILKKGHHRSKSDHTAGYGIHDNVDGEQIWNQAISSSLPKQIEDTESDSYYQYDDGQLVPKPYQGQSLYSYLESRNYDTGAQLDKENAHFSICEALIAAIEQMRCQSVASIRSNMSCNSMEQDSTFSDALSSTPTTNTSPSSDPTTDDTSDAPVKSLNVRQSIGMSWENVSLTPRRLKKELDFEKPEIIKDEEIPPNDYSAEAVAKSLLQKFSNHQLPAASDLNWIVSEMDAPQKLLPLPNAWPISPDSFLKDDQPFSVTAGVRTMSIPSLLRGTYEWAPPRPQIIFHPHPFVKRKIMMQRQMYRCCGCGLKVSPDLSKTFRLCEYLGKYFCTSCHQKEMSVIPSKILSKWDFKKYPVSDFARDLLKKIRLDALFNVMDASPKLYQNIRPLNIIKNYRIQLHYMKKFLETCRYAEGCQKELSKLSMHITDDPHTYSIDDLIQVKNGELQKALSGLLARGMTHIREDCQVCQLKGFICEICSENDILYPFELEKVSVCSDCKACYHSSCYVQGNCKKCQRIKARRQRLKVELPQSPELPALSEHPPSSEHTLSSEQLESR